MNKKLIFILGNCINVISFAQNIQGGSSSFNLDLFPKTPQSYAFSKFIDIPASNNTGVANFAIPLYEINFGGENIPIELSYSTNGIKVGELSSRVGLGWHLNILNTQLAGQVIGVKDSKFTTIGDIVDPNFNPDNGYPMSGDSRINPYHIALRTTGLLNSDGYKSDLKPDIYNYSIFNQSGKFILNSNHTLGIPLSFSKNRIELTNGDVRITDEKGTSFFFENVHYAKNINSCSSTQLHDDFLNLDYQIKKIVSEKGEVITFEYSKFIQSRYVTSMTEQYLIEDIRLGHSSERPLTPQQKCYNYTYNDELVLTKINLPSGSIEFKYNDDKGFSPREDIDGDVYLSEIILKNINNSILKNYHFKYDYFISTGKIPQNDLFGFKGIDKRLRLLEIKEEFSLAHHKFSYYDNEKLPHRLSNSQDFWGVYNGYNNEETSIASTGYKSDHVFGVFPEDFSMNSTIPKKGAIKIANSKYAILGNLKSIVYPTGGETKIYYELDDFQKNDFQKKNPDYYERMENTLSTTSSNSKLIFDLPNDLNIHIKFRENEFVDRGISESEIGNCELIIVDLNQGQRVLELDQYGVFKKELKKSKYEIRISPGYDNIEMKDKHCTSNFYYHLPVLDTSSIGHTGNIRVSKIESQTKDSKITREYSYKDLNNLSSGQVVGNNVFKSYNTQIHSVGKGGGSVKRIMIQNNPGWQVNTVNGKSVVYKVVKENYLNNHEKSYEKIYFYENSQFDNAFNNFDSDQVINISWPINPSYNGYLTKTLEYNDRNVLLKEVRNNFEFDYGVNKIYQLNPANNNILSYGLEIIHTSTMCSDVICKYLFMWELFPIRSHWMKKTGSTITEYFDNDKEVVTEIENIYSPTYNHIQPIATKTTNSKGETTTTEYQYPPDRLGDPIAEALTAQNRIAEPLIIRQKVGDTDVSETYTQYQWFNNNTLLQKSAVFQKKGKEVQEKDRKITYNSYDHRGNITQYTPEGGLPVSIIWGYNGQYPVAKIEGVIRSAINGSILTNLENSTSLTTSSFDDLRSSIPQAMITSYTYQPLVGVTSITGPNKQTEYYHYDPSGRLASITNSKAEVLKTFNYHYSTN